MSEEREIEMVTGTVDSIIQKGESKWQAVVKTLDAAQHGKKLWTKSQAQHDTIVSLLGQTATFECGVSHWTNSSGAPVRSLWINAINPGAPPPSNTAPEATGAPQTAPQPQQAPAPAQNRSADPTRVSIERQTALKAAVELHSAITSVLTQPYHILIENATLATAKRFVDFLETGLPLGEPPFEEDPPQFNAPPPLPVDEDIPF